MWAGLIVGKKMTKCQKMKKDKCVNLSVRTSAKREGLYGLEMLGRVSWIDGFMDEMQFELDLRTF